METDFPEGMEASTVAVRDRVRHAFIEGESSSMQTVEAVMREVAQSQVPVLLIAERGAGKTAIANRIHDLSPRCHESFRVIACDTLRPDVFEAAGEEGLAGHGTVYLKELADLTIDCQTKLLQLLTLTNGNGHHRARLIFGSSRDLEAEVKSGKLSEDLYYRVSGICLRLPPLRQRREDIPLLMEHFLRKHGQQYQRPVPRLSEETHRLFQEYSWPGNLRELDDAARAIVILGDEGVAMDGLRAMLLRSNGVRSTGRVSLKQASRAASREAEKELILKVLTRTHWNRRRAAQELQISYKALLYKLKQMGCSEYGAT